MQRGVAEMVLLYISACKGEQTAAVDSTLRLGISCLRGGNIDIQNVSSHGAPAQGFLQFFSASLSKNLENVSKQPKEFFEIT